MTNTVNIDIDFQTYKQLVMIMDYPNQPFDEIIKKLLVVSNLETPILKSALSEKNELNEAEPLKFINGKELTIYSAKKMINAHGKFKDARKKAFVIFKGSTISKIEDSTIPEHIKDIRLDLINKGIIDLNTYTFTKDYEFNSGSQAASLVIGGSRNYKEWEKNS